MERNLLTNHYKLVRKLEMEYTNHIRKLLKQKSIILNKLQQQFNEQRSIIKRIFTKIHSMQSADDQRIKLKTNDVHYYYLKTPIEVNKNHQNVQKSKKQAEQIKTHKKGTKRRTPTSKSSEKYKCPHCKYSTNHKGHYRNHL